MHIMINNAMAALGIPYEPIEWTGEKVPPVYFTSEFHGDATSGEDGESSGEVILVGHCNGSYAELLAHKDHIEGFFKLGVSKYRPETHESVRLKFDYWMDVPTGVEGFKRIEIYLTAKKWREYHGL